MPKQPNVVTCKWLFFTCQVGGKKTVVEAGLRHDAMGASDKREENCESFIM